MKYLAALPYLLLFLFLTTEAFAAANSWTVEKHPINSSLRFYWNDVATNPAMSIGTNNNVGIGTTSPGTHGEKVTINTGTTYKSIFQIGADQGGNILTFDVAQGAGLANIVAGAYWESPNYKYGGTRGASRVNLGDGAIGLYTGATGGTAGSNVSSWLTGLYINSAGNVGIGTTNPASLLEVKGSGQSIINMGQWVSSSSYGAIYLNGGWAAGGSYNILSSPADPNLYLNRPAGYAIKFRQANADQVTIDTNANLIVAGSVYSSNWLRTYGGSGWYSQDYGGGWHMTDSTWIRAYNGKNVYTPGEVQATTIRANNNLCMGACVDHIPLYHDYWQFDWQPPGSDTTDTYLADANYWRICYMRGASGFGDQEDAQIYRSGDQWRVWGRRGGWPALLRLACVR